MLISILSKGTIMKRLSMKGFTLIEMLVVVLIIGILAGVALPQYTRTVEKSRLAEAMITLSSLQRAVDMYVLANGYPNAQVRFVKDDPDAVLDVDVVQGLTCNEYDCASKYFAYYAGCHPSYCYVGVERLSPGSTTAYGGGNLFEIGMARYKNDDDWEKWCYHNSTNGYICQSLESQGYSRDECC